MRLALLAAAVVSIPSLAAASPLEVGVGGGVVQSSRAADDGSDAPQFANIYARANLSPILGAQLEVDRIQLQSGDDGGKILGGTGLLVVDLAKGPWVPSLEAGAGMDWARYTDDGRNQKYHHIEFGFALHYRTRDGLVLGIDGRIGIRTLDSQQVVFVDGDGGPPIAAGADISPRFFGGQALDDGQYRALKATIGVRF